eukprot:GHVR01105127.1.p2 GENE.GHVR01105127.1~~GHVR01105127.1.p2  ORF type:complete len:260 (-),score=64.88 GHVR01105127.1:1931-2710(-)
MNNVEERTLSPPLDIFNTFNRILNDNEISQENTSNYEDTRCNNDIITLYPKGFSPCKIKQPCTSNLYQLFDTNQVELSKKRLNTEVHGKRDGKKDGNESGVVNHIMLPQQQLSRECHGMSKRLLSNWFYFVKNKNILKYISDENILNNYGNIANNINNSINNINGTRTSFTNTISSDFNTWQSTYFHSLNSYADVICTAQTHHSSSAMRSITCLHVVNHLEKTRNLVLRNNQKVKIKSDGVCVCVCVCLCVYVCVCGPC